MQDSWDWVQEELRKIEQDMPMDNEMVQVVDAISVADFWKRRYDEEQMLWQRKLEQKEDEKDSLVSQAHNHESSIKEMNWKLKELERRWEQEKILLEDRLKAKEMEASLDKAKTQWEAHLKVLEQENKSLKNQLGTVTGIAFSPSATAIPLSAQAPSAAAAQVPSESFKKMEAEMKAQVAALEEEKAKLSRTLKEKEEQFNKEQGHWKTIQTELDSMSTHMAQRLNGLKEREQEHFAILEDLARGFAHRVRNYLGIMSGTIQLSLASYKMDAELEGQLNIVDQNVQEMLGSIEDFVKFSRIPEMTMQATDMNQLMESILQSFDGKLRNQNITVAKEFTQPLPAIEVDRALITEALTQLMQNSLESMLQGGQLTITTAYKADSGILSLQLIDSGSGITEAHIKKVFQPYFTTKKGRKGLGLTSAKRIVNLHKGTLSLSSTKAKGTTAGINFFIEPRQESSDTLR